MPARLYCWGAYCSKDGAGWESHACVPKRRSASKPKRLPTLPTAGRHEQVLRREGTGPGRNQKLVSSL